MLVHLIDICVRNDEPLADVFVLLHAGQRQRALASVRYDARICTKLEQHTHDVQVIVDRRLHQAGQTEIVHDIDIEDAFRVLALLDGPVIEQHFDGLRVALRAGDVQSVTTISIVEVDIDVLLEEQLDDVELVLSGSDE